MKTGFAHAAPVVGRYGSNRQAELKIVLGVLLLAICAGQAHGQGTVALPAPDADPMATTYADDPIVQLSRDSAAEAEFADLVRRSVERSPRQAVAAATIDVLVARKTQALGNLLPQAEIELTGYRVFDRYFGENLNTIIERSRPRRRSDLLLNVDQLVFDWLASPNRLHAAAARLASARDDEEAVRDRVGLEAISAWSDAFVFRALVKLSDDHSTAQRAIRAQLEQRIAAGASSQGDLAAVDREIAASVARRSGFERLAADAETRFSVLSGGAAVKFRRVPLLGPRLIGMDLAVLRAQQTAQVRSARRLVDATALEARAARGEALPRLSVGIEGGRYALLEGFNDREFRATFRLNQKLSLGTKGRIDEAAGRADLARAQYDETLEQSRRDITIAVQDVSALRAQVEAAELAYLSARRARDVIHERFRLSRGSLLDDLKAQNDLLDNAVIFLRAMSDHDAAHYALLSRTGLLLESLSIERRGGKRD